MTASAPAPPWASASWPALGTTASVFVTEPGALGETRALVEHELAQIDVTCSRFRPDSELSIVNRHPGHRFFIGPLFAEALDAALFAARATAGAVDPTVGRTLRLAGYDRDFDSLEGAPGRRLTLAPAPGWRLIELDRRHGWVRVPRGVELDLGATAKALAADRAALAAAEATGAGVLVNLGGDLSAAGPAPEGGWPARVTEDHRAPFDAPGQTVSIVSGGLATSSSGVRRWSAGGDVLHHIFDPATGRPAAPVWRTVSVAAASCVDANAASTGAIVRGEEAPEWLAALGLPARLVGAEGVVFTVGRWPEETAA